MDAVAYKEKFSSIANSALFQALESSDRQCVEALAHTYLLSFQEVRQLTEAARDLRMWREAPLADLWRQLESRRAPVAVEQRKKQLLRSLHQSMEKLRSEAKHYPEQPFSGPPRVPVKLLSTETQSKVFGRCPVYSDKTVCCGLYTIDAVVGCGFACSYCTIQTFALDRNARSPSQKTARLVANLPEKLRELHLDPQRFYHIGTGQASDSLLWGNRDGVLDALCTFAQEHPNVLLELKTKSKNVKALLARELPPNIVCSWSLNAPTIVRNEEHGTASLVERLRAARQVADRGGLVAFHLHPMVHFEGWQKEYSEVLDRMMSEFAAREVAFFSMGTLTFIRPVLKEIRRRGGETKILQMPLSPDPHGKYTYPDQTKRDLYRLAYQKLQPWRRKVFIYLCMEKASIWETVLGHAYESSEVFEKAFAEKWYALQAARADSRS